MHFFPRALAGGRPRRGGALAATLVAALLTALAVPAGASAAPTAGGDVARPGADLTSLVNPFIGTKNEGFDFPAVGEPFGMAQAVPNVLNAPGAGGNRCDSDSAEKIYGFSQTAVNACRYNYVPVMATTGEVTSGDPADYASSFNRAREEVHPDDYRVRLERYGVDVSLAATERTTWQRYDFGRTARANVLFNTGEGVSESEVHVVGNRTVEGWVAGEGGQKAYFVAKLSRPFTAHGTWKNDTLSPGSSESANDGANGGWVTFDTTKNDDPVVVKTALSYTGLAGARKNLDVETGDVGFDFDAVQDALHDRWNEMLHRVDTAGGSRTQRIVFYTALYHATLSPNVVGDVDGRYMGTDDQIHKAKGFTPYGVLSLWDTYRTQNQLVEMLDPKVAHDVARSIVAIARDGGWLPRWFLGNKDGNIMTGDPVTPFVVENWSKGLLSDDEAEEAYGYLRKNATQVPPADVAQNGRAGQAFYADRGYIPYGLHVADRDSCPTGDSSGACCPTHGNDNDCYYPASSQLEYAIADSSLALMAKGLGHDDDAAMFAERGQSYRNIYDKTLGTFRPRTADGTWLEPYDTTTGSHGFHESGPSQYQWMVPQDPSGLVDMMGGRRATTQKLDQFFVYSDLVNNPERTAQDAWVTAPYGYYGNTTYTPTNEPDLLAPYLYAWTGRPDKTATVVRAQQTLFTNTPEGMTGNDDMGEMSAWYVMAAIGLYPTMSGSNDYVASTPLFPSTTVRIGSYGSVQGGTLKLTAPGASMDKRYIATATVNGKDTQRPWVRQSDIAHGGTIDYALSTQPTSWGTSPEDAPPSVNHDPVATKDLSASLSPTAATVPASAKAASHQRLTLTVQATDPGTAEVTVAAKVPAGWKVSKTAQTVRISSDGLPTQVEVPVTVTAPAGTAAGDYPVTVTARASGSDPVRTSATVSAKATGGCAARTSTSCAVDLSGDYDTDGVASLADPGSGDLDGKGSSLAADLLPAAGPTTLDGVTYEAPSTVGTDANFVKAHGQTVALPAGRYSRLQILGTSTNGGTGVEGGTAVVTYRDGSTADVPVSMTEWTADEPEFGNAVALDMPYRVSAKDGKVSDDVALYRTSVRLDVYKTVRAITLPRPAVPEWVAPGLTGTAWDHDSDLNVYAMTLQGSTDGR
ncbi:GH92 family glycosyl hydrolase [Cellulomonas sp. PhB143]|uniref:GH92 family glycosyl hydrolase n=1 Tax=Cellulomonas sp. PhB143 TaxID=2485186 RepID=UPI000F48A1A9|nr:GH92 family glycosyl hydrolase [Cellulomonas sp. PhB143]ROS78833.1 putative alpha-1,2-mannosidase [Cellulomonas sp. PhB143]